VSEFTINRLTAGDQGGVHLNSTIVSHAAYLMTEGDARIARLGVPAAQKIWYRALTVYMTSSTNYQGARTASLNAARDLYGAASTQYNAVAAAWSAVSVN